MFLHHDLLMMLYQLYQAYCIQIMFVLLLVLLSCVYFGLLFIHIQRLAFILRIYLSYVFKLLHFGCQVIYYVRLHSRVY